MEGSLLWGACQRGCLKLDEVIPVEEELERKIDVDPKVRLVDNVP